MTIKAQTVGSIKNLKRSLKKGSGGYLKRIPSETGILVRFMTEPDEFVEYKEHYDENSEPRYFPCADECPACEDGRTQGSIRYLANVVDVTESRVEAIVLPKSVVMEMMRLYDKYGTIMDRTYELSRTGSGKNDTEYKVDQEGRSRFNMKRYEKIDLLGKLNSQLPSAGDDDDDDDDDDVAVEPRRPLKRKKPPIAVNKSSKIVKTASKTPVKKVVKSAPGKKVISRRG